MDEEQKSGVLVCKGEFKESVIRPQTEESFIAAARELQALIDDFTEKQGVGVILCLVAPSIDNLQKAYSGALVHAPSKYFMLAFTKLGNALDYLKRAAAINHRQRN